MSLFRRMRRLPPISQNPFFHYRSVSSSPSARPRHQIYPLRLLFQEAVGLSENEEIQAGVKPLTSGISTKLFHLEKEVRDLKRLDSISDQENQNVKCKEPEKRYSLYGLFAGGKSAEYLHVASKKEEQPRVSEIAEKSQFQRRRPEEPRVYKQLSDDMRMFITHLYKEGYFRDANFLRRGELDFDCFNDSYGRDFVKFAAEKFGKDNQDIAKWLSGSDLKKVALFGCPLPGRKNVFAAKKLRIFFGIKEETVCSKCVLKDSCHFVNRTLCKGVFKTLELAVVMRVITVYALETSHPELSVPGEIKASVSRLLKEIVKLSQTTS